MHPEVIRKEGERIRQQFLKNPNPSQPAKKTMPLSGLNQNDKMKMIRNSTDTTQLLEAQRFGQEFKMLDEMDMTLPSEQLVALEMMKQISVNFKDPTQIIGNQIKINTSDSHLINMEFVDPTDKNRLQQLLDEAESRQEDSSEENLD